MTNGLSLSNVSISIIEDEIIISKVYSLHLKKMGVKNIYSFVNGEDFMSFFISNNAVDLIILDIQLGNGMNGLKVAESIRELSNVPILFITGNENNKAIEGTIKIEKSKVLNKPIDFQDFKNEINNFLK